VFGEILLKERSLLADLAELAFGGFWDIEIVL
jgi:hypothetical protein